MSKRKQRRRPVACQQFLVAKLIQLIVVETVETILETTLPFGKEICESIRDRELKTFEYIAEMIAEIRDHHAATFVGCYGLAIFSQIAIGQFQFAVSLLPPHILQHLQDPHYSSPLLAWVLATGTFLSGYVASVLTNIAIREPQARPGTLFTILLSVSCVSSHSFTQPLFWYMFWPFVLSMFAGAPTARRLWRVVRR